MFDGNIKAQIFCSENSKGITNSSAKCENIR